MIPKIIHYCWFGRNPKNELIKKCMDSWKKYCPDFEIKEWNEENFNVNECRYSKEAYENKKWAFVSDYARHVILNLYGGIYLDTDVELLTNISNLLKENFIGFENPTSIASGLIMGCEANNAYCKAMIDSYQKDSFILPNGRLNTKMTVCERTTAYFRKKGLMTNGSMQTIDGYRIYPMEYFCPVDPITYECHLTEKTVSIHHYGGSWCTPEHKEFLELRAKYAKKHGRAVASTIAYFICKKERKGGFIAIFMTIGHVFSYLGFKLQKKI